MNSRLNARLKSGFGLIAEKPQINLVTSPPPPRRDNFKPWATIRANSFAMSTLLVGGPFSMMWGSPWGKITRSPASSAIRSPSNSRAEACPSMSRW